MRAFTGPGAWGVAVLLMGCVSLSVGCSQSMMADEKMMDKGTSKEAMQKEEMAKEEMMKKEQMMKKEEMKGDMMPEAEKQR